MLLRRRRSRKSKAKTYSLAMISLLILAGEVWYMDSLNAREMESNRIITSQKLVLKTNPSFSYPLMGEEQGGVDTLLFSREREISYLAHKFESVYISSNPCASIYIAQLPVKEAK
jgi:hypothetical protein